MTNQEMTEKVNVRIKELLNIPRVYHEYQNKETEEDAREWICRQALITLMYSHEERMEMLKENREQ